MMKTRNLYTITFSSDHDAIEVHVEPRSDGTFQVYHEIDGQVDGDLARCYQSQNKAIQAARTEMEELIEAMASM